MTVTLSLDDKWIWDFWLARDGDEWHIFHLQAPKSLIDPHKRHRNASYGHATSRDLRNWTHHGTCFGPSTDGPAWDDLCTWTGSVVKGDDGLWHQFYTANRRDEDCMYQRIGHATSPDLYTWSRVGNGLILDIDTRWYEEWEPGIWGDRAMRDPWVMRDPAGEGWVMYFTARVPIGDEMNARGAIGFARSPDLFTWTLEPPIYAGGDFGQLEVPQVFEIEGKWYMLFCTASVHWSKAYAAGAPTAPVSGTHYLVADSHLGPWTVAPGPFLDGATNSGQRYAGKIVFADEGLLFMSFANHPTPDTFGGYVGDPVPVTRDPKTGLLHVEG